MCLQPMAIGTQRLQVVRRIIVVVAVYMIDVQLTMPFRYKATPLAHRTLPMALMFVAAA